MSQYIRNMQQSYDRHQTGLEPGFEEELNRFVVSDWSADEFMSAPITTVAPDNQQAFDDFISQESIFEG